MAYKLSPFLANYRTILFDMDGVITGEEMYWNVAALTVTEMLNSKAYFGKKELNPSAMVKNLPKIRKKIFCDDKTIKLLKNKGVNSNWDLAYLVLGSALILHTTDDFERVYSYLKELGQDAFEMYETIGEQLQGVLNKPSGDTMRLGAFWWSCTHCFQEWFLGNEQFFKNWNLKSKQLGKTGLMFEETPIISHEKLRILLSLLRRENKNLGIGTGRPKFEIEGVLKQWEVLQYFNRDRIITYDHVAAAEAALKADYPDLLLTKPHPYMFIKGMLGENYPDIDIIRGNYQQSLCEETLVVGDAGADLFAAFDGGYDFAAVLTGIQKEEARRFFEKEKATYILENVLGLMEEV